MNAGIYKIKNKKNGKFYIGSSKNIKARFIIHKFYLSQNKHHSIKLQNAWNKYGKENFILEVIEEVEAIKEKLLEREQYYLDTLKPQYNICLKAGSPSGYKHSKERRKKISKALKERYSHFQHNWTGKHHTEETKRKMSENNGMKRPAVAEKLGKKLRGRIFSEETIERMSKAKKGLFVGEKSPNAKLTWEQVRDIRKEYFNSKISYKNLAKKYNVSIHAISYIIRNKTWKE